MQGHITGLMMKTNDIFCLGFWWNFFFVALRISFSMENEKDAKKSIVGYLFRYAIVLVIVFCKTSLQQNNKLKDNYCP